jgi:hypothetical protein
MADIVIVVAMYCGDEEDTIKYYGQARCSGMTLEDESINYEVHLPSTSSAVAINEAVKDAAVAAASVRGFTVGLLDKKILLGGAVLL